MASFFPDPDRRRERDRLEVKLGHAHVHAYGQGGEIKSIEAIQTIGDYFLKL